MKIRSFLVTEAEMGANYWLGPVTCRDDDAKDGSSVLPLYPGHTTAADAARKIVRVTQV